MRWGRLVLPIVCAAAWWGGAACSSFGDDPPGGDGGVDGIEGSTADAPVAPPIARDVEVTVDWPTVAELDPARRADAATIVITLSDAADPTRVATIKKPNSERGPFLFPKFLSSSEVDVVIRVESLSGLLVGHGERRRADVGVSPKVPVAVRRRLLYIASRDRDKPVGQLRTIDLAPSDLSEPSAREDAAVPELALVADGVSLYVTEDGLFLVEAGRDVSSGAVRVFTTGSHETKRTITVPFTPAVMAPLGDGHRALLLPDGSSPSPIGAVVDIDSGTVVTVQTSLSAGTLDATSMAVHPKDGRIFATAQLSSGGKDTAYLLVYDGSKMTASSIPGLSRASAVRIVPDGTRAIVVGGLAGAGSTGAVFAVDAKSPTNPLTPLFNAPQWLASSVVIDRDGRFAHVSGGDQGSLADMRTIDLQTGKEKGRYVPTDAGPRYQLVSAVELPYPPYRLLAGQSDPANNGQSTLVEVVVGGEPPVDVNLVDNPSYGSFHAMASPFARIR